MEKKLGARIAALRKAKAMTQEQLAAAVGVSAPAVSKWETDASCPDISLLCPIARALSTNVDTLLQFEETPPEEQITELVNEIIETARTRDVLEAEEMLQKLLHTYPSCTVLKYQASFVLTMFCVFSPAAPKEKTAAWQAQKKKLLTEVSEAGPSVWWQSSILQLAGIAIQEDELSEAEKLLCQLPEHNTDPTMTWAQLYLKRGEREKAQQVTQKRLFVLVRTALNCMTQLMSPEMEPDCDRALEICEAYRKTAELFEIDNGMYEGLFAELYKRKGETDRALASMIRFIDAYTGAAQTPKPALFSPAVKVEGKKEATVKEMRKLLLKALQEDDFYKQFHENAAFGAAIEKLRQSLQEEGGYDDASAGVSPSLSESKFIKYN